jgi:hypothetical protein
MYATSTTELLELSLGYMREHGHCKELYRGADETACMRGSMFSFLKVHQEFMMVPHPNDPLYREATALLAKVIQEQFPDRVDMRIGKHLNDIVVYYFNDHPDTTQADCELVFEKTILLSQDKQISTPDSLGV